MYSQKKSSNLAKRMYLVQGQTLSLMGVLGQEGMLVKFKANFFPTEVCSLFSSFKSVIFPTLFSENG